MDEKVTKAISSIERHIHECAILSQLLEDRSKHKSVDYSKYTIQGYTEDEISTGIELVDLFLQLKKLR